MKLDRDINKDGKGKYALVRLRTITNDSEAAGLLARLCELGVLDWGNVGAPDEFFLMRLKDKYAGEALSAYADAVALDARRELDEARSRDKFQYAIAVQKLCTRAGTLSPFCKEPD